ncbi:MAG: beta-galactosidase [Patescibacteria group bacterium]|nr:beta-galactosidase [Patescibacteria group bacterium]
MKRKTKNLSLKISLVVALILIFIGSGYLAMSLRMPLVQVPGVTFSKPYAEELKLDPREVLLSTLDNLKVRHFRIPAYWNLVQPELNKWDYKWLDEELDTIASRQGSVTLAVGEKLPRWPECWIPDWAVNLPIEDRENAALQYMTQTVNRYKNHPAVKAWQVENEPSFPFGKCPEAADGLFDKEVALVRSLDSKPIATTDSGELSFWRIGKKVDRLGISIYRVVIGPTGIFRYWFVPPQFYLRKSQVLGPLLGIKNLYVSEFQMEPWTKRATLLETPIDEQLQTFDLNQMKDNIKFAKNSGVSTIDYWGVEWWYWMMKTQNRPEFWETAKTIFIK